jgi:hypothetical protein
MRGRLFAVPLLLGGALVAPLTISPVAHGAAPPYTVTALRIKVQVPDCPGTPATPVSIAADLYRPAGASKTHRVPAILTTNGFGGSKSDQAGIGKAFASNGYAVLSYSGLGFGGSSCRISLDDRKHDGAAAAQLVDYLGGKTGLGVTDASPDPHGPARFGTPVDIDFVQHDATGKALDPRVGMVGGSYGGQIQYAATAASGGRIDTIVPVITWNDLAYSLAPNNTSLRRGVSYATPGVHKKDWTSLFFADGIASGLQYVTEDPPSRTVSTAPPTPP